MYTFSGPPSSKYVTVVMSVVLNRLLDSYILMTYCNDSASMCLVTASSVGERYSLCRCAQRNTTFLEASMADLPKDIAAKRNNRNKTL